MKIVGEERNPFAVRRQKYVINTVGILLLTHTLGLKKLPPKCPAIENNNLTSS
jgi:hypothetical protein